MITKILEGRDQLICCVYTLRPRICYVFTYQRTLNFDFFSWLCADSDTLSKRPEVIPCLGLLLLGFCECVFMIQKNRNIQATGILYLAYEPSTGYNQC